MPETGARFIKSASDATSVPRDGKPQVAMFGRSNVGKSSLVNALTGKKGLSRTSNTPGRTRLINLFDAGPYLLVDLPGYGFAKAAKTDTEFFQGLVIDYLDEAPIALALVVIDIRHEPTGRDRAMMESLAARDIPFVVVANKSDKLKRGESMQTLKQLRANFTRSDVIAVSTETLDGLGELKTAINNALRTKTE
ncbi:MAG: ribosome biogenesis GTP-binding protein YihA/YsxC [Patescibacteria group bacterium]